MTGFSSRCVLPYTIANEDTGAYSPLWQMKNTSLVALGPLPPDESAFIYQSEQQLGSESVLTRLAHYSGGGFVANLGHKYKVFLVLEFKNVKQKWSARVYCSL